MINYKAYIGWLYKNDEGLPGETESEIIFAAENHVAAMRAISRWVKDRLENVDVWDENCYVDLYSLTPTEITNNGTWIDPKGYVCKWRFDRDFDKFNDFIDNYEKKHVETDNESSDTSQSASTSMQD